MRTSSVILACLVALPTPAAADAATASAAGTSTLHGNEQRYEDRIRELTGTHGALAFELAEQWLALAFVQQQAGKHEDAVTSFETVLHIERVHKGLHHPDQIALLQSLAESNRALGDWKAVGQNHKLMRWINARGRAADDPERQQTLLQLALWHLEASNLPTGSAPYSHLSEAANIVEEALKFSAGRQAEDASELIRVLTLKAAVSHRIANHVSTWVGEPIHGVTPENIGVSAADPSDVIFRQNLIVSHYTSGRDALQRAAAIATREGDAAAQARCEQLLGDWQLLFGRRNAATQHYDRAEALGRAAGIDLFASPRRLPDFIDARPSPKPQSRQRTHFVRTRFDIDAQGRAQNVEILEVNPPDRNLMVRQARQQLREMRFRPRFLNGEAVKSEDIEIRIVFPQAQDAGGVTS